MPDPNTVDRDLLHLRKMFEDKTGEQAFIYNEELKGYVFNLNYLDFVEHLLRDLMRKTGVRKDGNSGN